MEVRLWLTVCNRVEQVSTFALLLDRFFQFYFNRPDASKAELANKAFSAMYALSSRLLHSICIYLCIDVYIDMCILKAGVQAYVQTYVCTGQT